MTATRLLVVEDELIIARGIEKRLRSLGYAVAGLAASGAEAVRRAADDPPPDLVLMDINLGRGMDGVEAAGLIRQAADIPVVFLTAHSDDATIQRAKLNEPHGYVLKPFDDKDLYTAIEIGLYRHRMTRRLRENERWLAATLASIGDGVIATDERGRVRFMNTIAERLTGWTQADALGLDVRDAFHIVERTTRRPVVNPALEALARGESTTLAPDTILVARDQVERPIDDSAAPILDVSGRVAGAVLVFRDVTERCRLEDSLRQAQKLEAVGLLAGGIAHDFNNMLTVINGYCQLLLAGDVADDQQREFTRIILDAGERAASLTQQLTAFSRKQVLMPTVLNLNGVVRDIGAMVRRLIGEDVEFVTDLAGDLEAVKVDVTQIGQVLLNLATNARDAMPRGGRLVVATANAVLDEQATRPHPRVAPGRFVRLSVADTGCGMPEEVRAKIFEPFFTTKEVGRGTGLGLATVHGIVTQSGGFVEVDSAVGRGTTFRVYLPAVADLPAAADDWAAKPLAGGSETILVVEDEPSVRLLLKTVLEQQGYTVLEASDGEDAGCVADAYPGRIDLLITDLVMPKRSGREVAEAMAASRPGLRVLYVSGYTDDVVVRQGVAEATAHFLHKPFNFDDLTQKVREVLGGGEG